MVQNSDILTPHVVNNAKDCFKEAQILHVYIY